MRSRFLGNIFRKIGDYLDHPDAPAKQTPEKPEKHAVPASYRQLTHDNYEENLKVFKKNHHLAVEALVTGSVELLGLSQVKERFGDQWELVCETAMRVVENTIEAKTKPNDLYLRINDEFYVILFNETPHEDAHFIAREIAYEISKQLYGEVPVTQEMVTVRGLALEIPPSEAAEKLDSVEQIITYIATARHRRESEQKAKVSKEIKELGIAYRPMVNVKKRMISLYSSTLIRSRKGEDPVVGLPAYPKDETGALTAEMDIYVLKEVGKILPDLGGVHKKAIILVPLHFDTLAVKRFRDRYVEVFKELDITSSHRLMLQLIDIPPGIPQGRLRNLLTVVFPFTLGFFCRIKRDDLDKYDFHATGIRGVSIDPEGHDRPTKKALSHFLDFARQAEKKKLRTLFVGLHHQDMASAMAATGFTYISGNALAGLVPKPGRAYRLDARPENGQES